MQAQQISANPMGSCGGNITCQSVPHWDKMPGPLFCICSVGCPGEGLILAEEALFSRG